MLTSITPFLSQFRFTDGALLLIAAVAGIFVARGCHNLAKRADPRVRLFLVLSLLNVSLLVLLYALPRAFAENAGPITAVTLPPPVLYEIPSVALFSVSFLKQYRDLLPLNGVAVALGLWALMGFRFAVTAPPDTEHNVSVMSWNLASKPADLHGIMNGIRASSPEIVCLQAVPDDASLSTRLPAYRWYQSKALAIGTVGDISDRNVIGLPSTANRALESTVTIHGRDYDVVNADLGDGKDETAKLRQKSALKTFHAFLSDKKRRLVIAVALGAQPSSPEYQAIAVGLIDSFEQAGTGFGYTTPSGFPLRRSDYLFISSDCAARSSGPLNMAFSDHLPISAVIGSLFPQSRSAPAN